MGYGAEHTEDERGGAKGNLFGRINPEYWAILCEIGLRVWKYGEKKVKIIAL